MDSILDAFSLMKMYEFHLRFHLNVFPKGQINNIPALVQMMVCRRPGNKPLSEPMMVSLLMHICHSASMSYSTTICKLVDLILALHQSDGRIPN